MQYKVAVRDGVCEAVTSGAAEVLKFRELLVSAFRQEGWVRGMPCLFDHSDLDSGPLTVDDVRCIADYCVEFNAEFAHGRVAAVLRRDLEFGLARMWGFFVEGRMHAVIGVFRSREDALQWLKQAPPRQE